MNYSVFIGIDVSKEKLDFVVLVEGKKVFHMEVKNNSKGIKEFLKALSKTLHVAPETCLFCLEHTGIYCNHFLKYANSNTLSVWLEDAMKIKVYHGLAREKNDALDAYRIAEYAYAKKHQIKLWEAPRDLIKELKNLLSLRERLVDTKIRIKTPMKEQGGFCDQSWNTDHKRLVQPILNKVETQIREVERKIKQIINGDQTLKKLFDLIVSVRGVGLIVGANTLVVTNEFKGITDPKKMACHCGVAPFKKQSGKSIRGKSKVSHQAHKKMKSLLNLSARSAIRNNGELRDYYLRKVAEGKNKMGVMNAVRNKIIHRMFACVRDDRKYENIYVNNLV